jgi:indolepyruvate ferredoxin oxidoreductase beta subunit
VLLAPDLIPEADLPNKRSLNVALLGALSTCVDLPVDALLEAMRAALPERLHAVNERAFELGRSIGVQAGLRRT